MPFEVEYSPTVEGHLERFTARERLVVLNKLEEQLRYEPTLETRNRKRMRPNRLAVWELRIGAFRVYDDVMTEPRELVVVQAMGVKDRNVVRIGNEVIEL